MEKLDFRQEMRPRNTAVKLVVTKKILGLRGPQVAMAFAGNGINCEKYTFCVIKSLEHLQNLTNPLRPLLKLSSVNFKFLSKFLKTSKGHKQ